MSECNAKECCQELTRVWSALGITEFNGKSASENVSDLRSRLEATERRATESERQLTSLAYEMEGGNRWPVDWSEDGLGKALDRAKGYLASIGKPLPVWERNGPGFKRKAIAVGGERGGGAK